MSQTPPENTPDEGTEPVKVIPNTTEGSGQFAVWDHDLSAFVSGVGDKKTAEASKKSLEEHNGVITDGHNLEVLEV